MSTLSRRVSDRRFAGPMPDRVRHARRLLGISQSEFAKRVGVGPSAVAQWELPRGTSPNVAHMMRIAQSTGVAFEWLATGRGTIRIDHDETPAVEASLFAADVLEERLLLTFRRVTAKRREALVRWLEDFV